MACDGKKKLDTESNCSIPVVIESEAELCHCCGKEKIEILICDKCFDKAVREGA